MFTTLGRNYTNGNAACVLTEEEGKVYIIGYKQNNGSSSFTKEVFRFELTESKLNVINQYFPIYNKL